MVDRKAELGFSFVSSKANEQQVRKILEKEMGVILEITPVQLECRGGEGVRIYGECKAGEDSKLTGTLSKVGIAEVLNTLIEFEDLTRRVVKPYGVSRTVWFIRPSSVLEQTCQSVED